MGIVGGIRAWLKACCSVAGQLITIEIGVGVGSVAGTTIRKRPSGATSYCCFGPAATAITPLGPEARRVVRNSGTGALIVNLESARFV
jgi:hypothetical protein